MTKVYRKIGIDDDMWGQVVEAAARRRESPNSWIIGTLSEILNGTLSVKPVKVNKKEEAPAPAVVARVDGGEDPNAPNWMCTPTILRIRELQMYIEQEEFNLAQYLRPDACSDPVTGDPCPDDPEASYIVETQERLEAYREELDSLTLGFKEIQKEE